VIIVTGEKSTRRFGRGLALQLHETSAPDVVAQFGGDVTLSCLFPSPPGMNLQRLTLTWQKERAGAGDLVVHSYYYGKEQLERQDEAYRNRTQLDPEGLAQGNASLTLRGVRIQDEGVYLCHITSEQGKISERRQVKVMGKQASPGECEVSVSSQVTLTCCAEGGYPEASVLWLDGAGNNVTAESDTRLQRDPSGLYNCTNNLCLLIALPLTVLLGNVSCFSVSLSPLCPGVRPLRQGLSLVTGRSCEAVEKQQSLIETGALVQGVLGVIY
uniref:Ig-like domain-containing protein n=1 Tax=Terrapene triunguis TaxID=2587831 RepID=A0A674J0T1_9SAUR